MCACITLVRSVISDCIRIIILFSDYFLHYVWPSVHHYFLCLVLSVLLLSQSEPVHQFSQELSTDIQLLNQDIQMYQLLCHFHLKVLSWKPRLLQSIWFSLCLTKIPLPHPEAGPSLRSPVPKVRSPFILTLPGDFQQRVLGN